MHGSISGGRVIMVIGIGSAPLAHILLTRLLAIVETVRLGDPFVAGNAARLQTTAWALLGLELLHLAVGAIAAAASPMRSRSISTGTFRSPAGSRCSCCSCSPASSIYGTRMRDDLEGTV